MSNLHLVTGYAGVEHVTSNDHGSLNAAMFGNGEFVLERGNQFAASIQSNNKVRVLDGDLLMQGRHIRLKENTYVDLNFDNGTQGCKRLDLIVVRYSKSSTTGVEEANLVVIKGTPSETSYNAPDKITGDILTEGTLENDTVLYRVKFDGLNIQPLEKVFETVSSPETLQKEMALRIKNTLDAAVEDAKNRISEVIGGLCKLTVTCNKQLVGETVTCSDGGSHTYAAVVPKSMVVTFAIPILGTWTVTSPVTDATKSVTMKYYGAYETELQCYKVLSAIIDFTMSNPSSMVTYADGLEGYSKQSSAILELAPFAALKNVVLNNGQVVSELNKSDFTKYVDGTASDITTLGNDVMLQITKRLGYMIEWQDSGKTKLKVSVTDKPDDENYEYDAFSLDSYNDCDWIAIGTYKGYMAGGKAYSSSGKDVTVSQTIDTFRNACRARGNGYQQRTFGSLKLMQCLYILYTGNLNSQSAIGCGYTFFQHKAGVSTGGTNAYGFNSEIIKASNPSYMTDKNHQVKCLGIEDFWGNYWEFIDGVHSGASRNILTCDCAKDFVTSGSRYADQGNGGISADLTGYASRPQGGNKAGFTPQAISGSDSTYFCDFAFLGASCLCIFGGAWSSDSPAGAFQIDLWGKDFIYRENVACRLMYMHKETA